MSRLFLCTEIMITSIPTCFVSTIYSHLQKHDYQTFGVSTLSYWVVCSWGTVLFRGIRIRHSRNQTFPLGYVTHHTPKNDSTYQTGLTRLEDLVTESTSYLDTSSCTISVLKTVTLWLVSHIRPVEWLSANILMLFDIPHNTFRIWTQIHPSNTVDFNMAATLVMHPRMQHRHIHFLFVY